MFLYKLWIKLPVISDRKPTSPSVSVSFAISPGIRGGLPQLHPFWGLGYLRVGPGGLDEAHAFVDADEAQAEEAEASPAADAPGGKGVGFGDGVWEGYIYHRIHYI